MFEQPVAVDDTCYYLPVVSEMSYLLNERTGTTTSRLFLTAIATKEIHPLPTKIKFVEGLTYAILCAAFGFNESTAALQKAVKTNTSGGDAPEAPVAVPVVSELDVKRFLPSPIKTTSSEEANLVEEQSVSGNNDDPAEMGRPTSFLRRMSSSLLGAEPRNRSIYQKSVSAEPYDKPKAITILPLSKSASEPAGSRVSSSHLLPDEVDQETKIPPVMRKQSSLFRVNSLILGKRRPSMEFGASFVPKNIPTWEPPFKHNYPIALVPVKEPIPVGGLCFEDFSNMRHLADGSNANVFVAEWKGKTVVVKVIKEEIKHHPIALHEFEVEHGILARLSHPNIIRVLGSGIIPRRFLVLEYMSQGTLNTILHKNVIKDTATLPEKLFRKPSFTYLGLLKRSLELAKAFHYIHRECHPEAMILHRGKS